MSVELRKVLFRRLTNHQHAKAFRRRTGTVVSVRNSERDFKILCRKAGLDRTGVRCSWHVLRHTVAVNNLRVGGNIYYLQQILGHSSISTTNGTCGALDSSLVFRGGMRYAAVRDCALHRLREVAHE